MKTVQLETEKAANRYFAYMDAVGRSNKEQANATPAERKRAQTSFDLLDMAYDYDAYYITWRKKFIAIKLVGAKVTDAAMLAKVEEHLDTLSVEKAVTPQGTIYRIAR